MKTWTLLFEALGVLMFRDHRPFDAGRDGIARSRFPHPSVFRGAVRTALFQSVGANFTRPGFGLEGELAALLGDATRSETFALRGPMLAWCGCRQRSCACTDRSFEYLLPWPADLVERGSGDASAGFEVLGGRPTSPDSACFRWGAGTQGLRTHEAGLPWAQGKLGKPSGGTRCLTAGGAEKYVQTGQGGGLDLRADADFVPESAVMQIEQRVGLARATRTRGRSLTAARGMLYTLLTYRLADHARFAVEVDVAGPHGALLQSKLEALDGRSIRLGGQSGHVRLEVVRDSIAPTWKASPGPTKLWAWTPTPWAPNAPVPGLRYALGEAVRLGGFDMHEGRPRPLRGAVDRGAVLRFDHGAEPRAFREFLAQQATKHGVPPDSYGYGHWSTVE